MRTYEINDILYTKDGRKVGNLVILSKTLKQLSDFPEVIQDIISKHLPENATSFYTYEAISDYGNIITISDVSLKANNQFFKVPGKADITHKHYNYKQTHPEDFI